MKKKRGRKVIVVCSIMLIIGLFSVNLVSAGFYRVYAKFEAGNVIETNWEFEVV